MRTDQSQAGVSAVVCSGVCLPVFRPWFRLACHAIMLIHCAVLLLVRFCGELADLDNPLAVRIEVSRWWRDGLFFGFFGSLWHAVARFCRRAFHWVTADRRAGRPHYASQRVQIRLELFGAAAAGSLGILGLGLGVV